jgi:hypothetical protein
MGVGRAQEPDEHLVRCGEIVSELALSGEQSSVLDPPHGLPTSETSKWRFV